MVQLVGSGRIVSAGVLVGVTGQIVVEIAIVLVTTRPGQLVTDGGHEVTVKVVVE